ncbi:hypothetical protein [Desulfobacula sp.]|uniref:hypothetical protein n=1 Tax=Desulfobacula sp. TaxID=2593537 RepID=UPI00263548E6|nr:hypothetical protein [Desulfobacula sp.]
MAKREKISSTVGKSDHGPVGKLLLPKTMGYFPVGKSVLTEKCGSWGFGLLSYSTALYNIPSFTGEAGGSLEEKNSQNRGKIKGRIAGGLFLSLFQETKL